MSEGISRNLSSWRHPTNTVQFKKLKSKKLSLDQRIKGVPAKEETDKHNAFESVLLGQKRKNPFALNDSNKKAKTNTEACFNETSNHTLFKLLHNGSVKETVNKSYTSFDNILSKIQNEEVVEVVKAKGEKWLPIDWALKTKVRLLSLKPFPWHQKLKINEEASGVTAFARCLEPNNPNYLDDSPNAKFHQCSLYWQHPHLPWLKLFPRNSEKLQNKLNLANDAGVKNSLQNSWFDSFRSLFQLIRTRQCPYFYVCANKFTVLFRAAGICGYNEVHALVSPTTRGFRSLLRAEDIEFNMPLQQNSMNIDEESQSTNDFSESVEVTEEEVEDDNWLKSLGINADEIKQIKCTQQKIIHKAETKVDNSEQSLLFIKGSSDVHSFYNFLLNCKSTIAIAGPLAGIPPTLLAPVAFGGATLSSLKVMENRAKVSEGYVYSIELSGPILPSTVQNLLEIHPLETNITAIFQNLTSTNAFSKVQPDEDNEVKNNEIVFLKENLSACGLSDELLKKFCKAKHVVNLECLKYDSSSESFTWN